MSKMPVLTEIARAKVNLTLAVLGRRPDGYHELRSLVAFTETGDRLQLDDGDCGGRDAGPSGFTLEIDGRFAAGLEGENLVSRAVEMVHAAFPALRLGRVTLTKTLPVAAGLGGGSADAAAMLRLLARANPGLAASVDLRAIARGLGADVTVCLEQRAALMWGIGERTMRVGPLPACWLVLANPGVPLATRAVFRALTAPPYLMPSLPSDERPELADLDVADPDLPGPFAELSDLVGYLRGIGNALQKPAMALCPLIGQVLSALTAMDGCLHAAQSGSGPTCFGIFETEAAATLAARALTATHPAWWLSASRLAS